MTYTMTGELPTQVRGAFDEKEQVQWMNEFNQCITEGMTPREAWKYSWHRVARKGRYMSGIVSREVPDRGDKSHGKLPELLDQTEVVEAINNTAWKYGLNVGEIHSNRPCGVWFDAEKEIDEKGIPQTRIYGIAFKGDAYFDEKFWPRVKDGLFKGLSIAIFKPGSQSIQCEGTKCWKRISGLQVFEVSAVPEGLCPGTVLDDVNLSAKGSTTMTEEKTETDPVQSPEAASAGDLSNKEALGDLGIEALQRLLMMASDTKKAVEAVAAKLDAHIAAGNAAMGLTSDPNNPLAGQQQGQPPMGQPPVQGQEQGGNPQAQAPAQSPQNSAPPQEGKKDEEKKDDKSDKAITPQLGAHTKEEETEEQKLANKQAELNAVKDIQDRQAKAMTEGTHTPRPDSALNDKGGQTKDALQELLGDEEKLSHMSAKGLDQFIEQYMRGEI